MNICLGVLAHNEKSGIKATLDDVLKQDLWSLNDHRFHLLVIVNGSTDETATIAKEKLKNSNIIAEVVEVERPGKANAWNRLVHELAAVDTDLFFLADADIRLPQPEALRVMLETLEAHPQAVAVVDVPVKDLAGKDKKGAVARLSLSASDLASAGPPKLCGQLYAARAEAMRKIFLPEPMLVEDGFIKAMLVRQRRSSPISIAMKNGFLLDHFVIFCCLTWQERWWAKARMSESG
jgi:glycosyltransferase involved in cell wall biosynthesis